MTRSGSTSPDASAPPLPGPAPQRGRAGLVGCEGQLRSRNRRPLPPLHTLKRILVIKDDAIGDLLLAAPFLRGLRESAPQAQITLMVRKANLELAHRCPCVDRVAPIFWQDTRGLRAAARTVVQTRRLGRFDLAIHPRYDARSLGARLAMLASGARYRVGFDPDCPTLATRRRGGADRLLTHSFLAPGADHELLQNLALLRASGGDGQAQPEAWFTQADRTHADLLIEPATPPLIGLALGAGEPKRAWPPDRLAQLTRHLAQRGTPVLLGGMAERPLADYVLRRLDAPAIDAVGWLSLPQSAALLSRCELLVSHDSGLAHMAAAVNLPVVVISAHPEIGCDLSAHSPVRFAPFGRSIVVQPPSFQGGCQLQCSAHCPHCILGVSVERVVKAVDRLWPCGCGGRCQPCRVASKPSEAAPA